MLIFDNGTAMTFATILTKYEGISFKPGNSLGFKAYIMSKTSARNVGLRNMEFGDSFLGNLRKSCLSWSAYVCASLLPTLAK